jgi:flagellar biosynthetic protein FliR
VHDSIAILSSHLGPALLVLVRLGGLAIFAPIFASSLVPRLVKVLLILLLGLATYPTLALGPLRGAQVPTDLASIAPMMVSEVMVGAVIGFLAIFPLVAMQMAGQIMGTQIGLGFARLYNPAMEDEGDVLEQILFFLGLSSFLAVGGHEQMTLAVLRSFEYVRLGGVGEVISVCGWGIDNGLVRLLASVLLAATELSLRVAAPMISLFLLESVALGYLSKSVPSFHLMNLGFPLRIIIGLGILILGMGAIGEAMHQFLADDISLLSRWFVLEGAH